ncbi:hypothetical protein C0993_006191 [Termitomyces sp. T159_Od127]|nr:hypothetical protein C0993_006191 [Termitomyces sp. T159_Od127]
MEDRWRRDIPEHNAPDLNNRHKGDRKRTAKIAENNAVRSKEAWGDHTANKIRIKTEDGHADLVSPRTNWRKEPWVQHNYGKMPEEKPQSKDNKKKIELETRILNTGPTEGMEDAQPRIGPPQWIKAYTDGSCMNNGFEDAKAGAGVWYSENDPRNVTAKVPAHLNQTNNAGEALAILIAAKDTNAEDHLEILSDSKITLDSLTKSLEKWEDIGWIGVENREILQATASHLRARKGQTILTKVKGHSGLEGNEMADELAKKGANLEGVADVDVTPKKGHYKVGVKLSKASQALLYKGIIEEQDGH